MSGAYLAGASRYVFPVQPSGSASYGRCHHDYPATDIFAPVGLQFVAATSGTVDFVSRIDRWDPRIDDPATRSGIAVAIVGMDGVRYYGSHLSSVTDGIARRASAGGAAAGADRPQRQRSCHAAAHALRHLPPDEPRRLAGPPWTRRTRTVPRRLACRATRYARPDRRAQRRLLIRSARFPGPGLLRGRLLCRRLGG